MAEFNWNDHPIADEKATSGAFNWDDHPIAEPDVQAASEDKEKPETVSAGRAALVGAGKGVSFGFNEELEAPFAAGAAMFNGVPDLPYEEPGALGRLEKFTRLMDQYKALSRDEAHRASEEHPVAYTAGAVGGSLLLPGLGLGKAGVAAAEGAGLQGAKLAAAKIGAGAAEGAAQGALTGAGEAEGGIVNTANSAVQGGTVGGLAGAAIPAAAAGIKTAKGIGAAAKEIPIVGELGELYERGAKGQNLITKAGRQEAEDVVRNEFAGQLAGDLKTTTQQVGKQIGAKIDEASANGTKVDLTDEINQTLETLKEMRTKGPQDSRANAANIEDEIKSILGIKDPAKAVDELAGGPEGLIAPKVEEAAVKHEVDPKVAQELKQLLQDYSPTHGMNSAEYKSARVADDLKGSVKDKLNEVTGLNEPTTTGLDKVEGPSLNKQFSDLKTVADTRLKIDYNDSPNNIRDKITALLSGLEKTNVPGSTKREIIKDAVQALKQVNPEMAAKYEGPLTDAVQRLELAQNTVGGGGRAGLFGTTRAAAGTVANAAGLATNKIGLTKAASGIAKATETLAPLAQKGAPTLFNQSTEGIQRARDSETEPYKIHRQIAKIAETSAPETLTAQAAQVREQYGEQGNSLATILENMSKAKPDSRRALMFTVLQNPAYKKMLGLGKEDNE